MLTREAVARCLYRECQLNGVAEFRDGLEWEDLEKNTQQIYLNLAMSAILTICRKPLK